MKKIVFVVALAILVWFFFRPVFAMPPIPAECAGMTFDKVIVGTDRAETLRGTNGRDLIFGMGGADSIYGNGGDDCLVGGDGADSIRGGDGNDVLIGGADADSLKGENGNDVLVGEFPDTLNGGSGIDTCYTSTSQKSCEL